MIQTAWARILVRALRDAGARDFVISPGSRSTPLIAAAVAEGAPLHVIVDERSAAFFALGQARVTGAPAVLVCTSGSALAHYFPAVVEAAEARVPLVVVSADRPPELHGCSAPQTIDQLAIFGDRVRMFADLGGPEASDLARRAARRKAVQAVHCALWPVPGPVHLNVPARKPLEPEVGPEVDAAVTAAGAACPPWRPKTVASTAALDALIERIDRTERGVIVAGPAPLSWHAHRAAVERLTTATGYPLLAEATSQLRFAGRRAPAKLCDGFDVALGRGAADLCPELIVQLGAPPTSGALSAWMAASGAERWIFTDAGWPDPDSDAAGIIYGEVGDALTRLAGRVRSRAAGAWSRAFAAASADSWERVERALAAPADGMTEGQAMRAVVSALPDGALLMLGNSLPIRTVDTYCPGRTADLGVLHQRGANGIDGLISGAAGAASAAVKDGTRRPVVLVLGDVSFLHDIGGLAAARAAMGPLSIVVIDNGGGRIFDQLPLAAAAQAGRGLDADSFERTFRTPPRIDFPAAAGLFGHWFERAHTADELARAIRETTASAGCAVIHAVVAPDSAQAVRRRILEPS